MSTDSKAFRRYQASVERALGLFDATHEWADYIAFLSRLQKALHTHPEGETDIPLKSIVAKHLAQCLNPTLPSGVHQKALEVYDFIFSLIGVKGLSRDLGLYLPGFAHTLAFASLSIRPLFLSLIEGHVLELSSSTLRPASKAIILSLLPGLEEETSEDFEPTLAAVNKLRQTFVNDAAEGFFWQSLFLASVTNPYRRSGVLVYLSRYLPMFGNTVLSGSLQQNGKSDVRIETSTVLYPEPGLLIRCFATGLQDEQTLIQRGFLDLLVTHLPLNAYIFRHEVVRDDVDLLVNAAITVVLRRDMSLNRRLWSWFLGPDTLGLEGGPISPSEESEPLGLTRVVTGETESPGYMHAYGLQPLIRVFQKLVSNEQNSATERARPYRIGLSLMDRWEIGGPVVQASFIPLMRSLCDYQKTANSQEEYEDLFRSANVFFNGVESHLIWSQMFALLKSRDFDLFEFILSHFNLQEEEMQTLHIPMNALAISEYLLRVGLPSQTDSDQDAAAGSARRMVKILHALVSLFAAHVVDHEKEVLKEGAVSDEDEDRTQAIGRFYGSLTTNMATQRPPFVGSRLGQLLLENVSTYFLRCLVREASTLPGIAQVLTMLTGNNSDHKAFEHVQLISEMIEFLNVHDRDGTMLLFSTASSMILVLTSVSARDTQRVLLRDENLVDMASLLVHQLWPLLASQTTQYHVEVSQCLWDLHKIAKHLHIVESALMDLMVSPSGTGFKLSRASFEHFAVLWAHIGTTVRSRGLDDTLSMLKQPLILAIDSLDDSRKDWLQSLPNTMSLYHVVLEGVSDTSSEEIVRLKRLQNIMKLHSREQWHQFCHIEEDTKTATVGRVLPICMSAIRHEMSDIYIEESALSILRLIYGQNQLSITSDDGQVVELLTRRLARDETPGDLQTSLLETLIIVLGHQRPNSDVLTCLLRGVSTTGLISMEKWISTLCLIAPSLGDSIFQIVIQVTEIFCNRFESIFATMCSMYTGNKRQNALLNGIGSPRSPSVINPSANNASLERAIFSILAGLEYIIARAHERLMDREAEASSAKSPEQPQGLFGNIIAASQPSAEMNQLRGSVINDRLTVVLCFQDFIKICVRIWSWGSDSRSGAIESKASFHYMSSKMRVKGRRILENLLEAEPQECLETIIENWVKAVKSGNPSDHESILRLLQTLNGARPRIMMPATFNAIYNRTNPTALDKHQKSTMSTDVSALELLSFLIEYTKALEDDLLDEIWVDCTTFLREVLGNPMPHRQILLRLLEFVAVLCSKMENTNFGEETKMRRELGELCIRLFTAIFTVKPGGEDSNLSFLSHTDSSKVTEAQPPYLGPGNAIMTLCKTLPALISVLKDSDRMATAVSGIMVNITGPMLRSKILSQSASADFFSLLQLTSKSSGAGKLWRRDVLEAFNDPKFFQTPADLAKHWLPIVQHLLSTEKQLMSEILTRLTPPTTAGLVFGVGASSARTEADKRAQLNLRRVIVLILASDADSFMPNFRQIMPKIEELLTATNISSPSSATRADVYMLIRALILKTSPFHLSPLWPMIDTELHAVFSATTNDQDKTYNVPARLQAAKLLDLLLLLKPDEFQLHEWLYVTDTVDAIYPPNGWTSSALVDQVAQDTSQAIEVGLPNLNTSKTRTPWLCSELTRTTAAEDVESLLLRPFFNQLSIHAFEDVYGLRQIDLEACELDLLADMFET